jgi:hypothetical protein
MSEEANLLRSMAYADKEAKITAVTVTDVPSLFTSALTSGYSRKRLSVYNYTGEVYYSFESTASVSGESLPIPENVRTEIKIKTEIPVYFFSVSGETGDLRVEELA